MTNFWKFGAAIAAMTVAAAPASAVTLYGLTAANTVVAFDSATPGTTIATRAITGLVAGDVLTGFDLRPATGALYTIAFSGNLYRLDLTGTTYTAALIGDSRPAGDLVGTRFGVDFNPTVDRLRVVSDFDQNLRINPDTAAAIVDGTISAPGAEALVGAAYANNVAGATTTMLYTLDASGNQLLLSSNANAGTYNEIGVVSGIDFGALNNVGFDISGLTGQAFFSEGNQLYSLNLTTAAATSLGTIAGGPLIGLTAAAVPEPASWAMMIGGFGIVGGSLRRRAAVARREQLA